MKKILTSAMVAAILSAPIAILLCSFFYLSTWIFILEVTLLSFITLFWKTYTDLKREEKK